MKYLLKDFNNRLRKLDIETVERFNQLYTDIEDTQRLRKRDKSDHVIEFNKINKDLLAQYQNLDTLALALNNAGEMIACLIEAFKILQAMDNQDEMDKHLISL
jgi:hypothetical protein